MIQAVFFKENGCLSGFSISGHSGFAESGRDIVCACVSSAAMLTVNTITDFFIDGGEVVYEENLLGIKLKNSSSEASYKLIESFHTHLRFIEEEYPLNIEITVK